MKVSLFILILFNICKSSFLNLIQNKSNYNMHDTILKSNNEEEDINLTFDQIVITKGYNITFSLNI